MPDTSIPRDPHAQARANIRETMKWMVTGFGAVAVAIVGGTPLTGIGMLKPDDGRLALAAGSGLFGLAMLGLGIKAALRVLVTPPFFLRDVLHDPDLLNRVNEHAPDCLPPQYTDLKSFIEDCDRAVANVRENNADAADSDDFLKTAGLWSDHLVGYAYFELLLRRLEEARRRLFTVGLLAAVSFAVFAWAANPPRPDNAGVVLPAQTSK